MRVRLPLEDAGGVAADVAEALDDIAGVADFLAVGAQQLFAGDDHAAAGGLVAADRAEQIYRLTGDHAGMEAVELAVLVHDPRHDLGVGIDVGGGNVDMVADQIMDAGDELAGQALQLMR